MGVVSYYYNWTAAIASNDSSSFDTPTYNDPTANPQNSICPKSWRLPTISNDPGTTPGSTNEFRRLNILYNSNSTDNPSGLMSAPLYLSRSGYVGGGSLLGAGGNGYYWSSTVYSSENARYLFFYDTRVSPEFNYYRYCGFSLRCVARYATDKVDRTCFWRVVARVLGNRANMPKLPFFLKTLVKFDSYLAKLKFLSRTSYRFDRCRFHKNHNA